MNKILNSSIQTKSKKESKYIPILIKYRSESDLYQNLKDGNSLKHSKEFISEIHNFQTVVDNKSQPGFSSNQQEPENIKPSAKTVDLKMYLK